MDFHHYMINDELNQCSEDIKSKQNTTEHAKTMIKKYNEQQKMLEITELLNL